MQLAPQKDDVLKVNGPGRRSFVVALFGVSGAVVSALLAFPLVRFVTYPLRKGAAAATWSDVGPVQDFASLTAPVAKTITLERRDAWQTTSSQTAVYVLPSKAGQLRILSPICPHLGCSVRWVGDENKFVCPCHAGSFTADGERISRTTASLHGRTRIQSRGWRIESPLPIFPAVGSQQRGNGLRWRISMTNKTSA